MESTRAVTVKLPTDLYQKASDLVALTGQSFRDLFAAALRKELEERLAAADGEELRKILDRMQNYRSQAHLSTT